MRAHCVTQRLRSVPGVTSMGRKAKREGVCASAELTHFAVQWKLTQHCKTTLLQEKFKNQEQVMQRGRDNFGLNLVVAEKETAVEMVAAGVGDRKTAAQVGASLADWQVNRARRSCFCDMALAVASMIPRIFYT